MTTMPLPRILISAPHRSSGKTTLSIGLCAALSRAGLKVQPFKKGPDFIDPMWLSAAAGRDCYNLDLFMMGEENIRRSFCSHAADADLSLIEGNMGLYDSTDLEGKGSTSDMARSLKAPVILIVSTRNLTRSIAPLLLGFERFEPDISIAGVILNKVSGQRHESKLRAAIERYTDLEVLGAIRRRPEIGIIQRHLGLKPAKEEMAAGSVIDSITAIMSESVDLGRIKEIAGLAAPLKVLPAVSAPASSAPLVKIGVALDRAFTFYYPENLEALRRAGAELVPFSPIGSDALPNVDALYIGGGFPEVFMEELEANSGLRNQVRVAVEGGMPVYAECGGLMYLCRSMIWQGDRRQMAGALPCDIVMHQKPRGHGYMELRATGAGGWFNEGLKVRGHEFHYSEVVNSGGLEFAYQVVRGHGVDGLHDGIVYRNVLASYTHLHSLGSPGWAEGFVEHIKNTLNLPHS